ncbi:P80 family lipoprotein [Mycoplasma sp. E35C]|nr:P80 family lipoprotein [Mycoplasma sp. E35C]
MSLASASALIAASCGHRANNTGKPAFDQIDDGKIVVANTFSTSSTVYKAIEDVIKEYNKQKSDSDYEVVLRPIGSGYPDGSKQTSIKLETSDTSNFYNLIFNYDNIVANLLRYNMGLAFDKGENKVDTSKFAKEFLDLNYQIAGNTDQSIYSLPFTKSTEVLVTNIPVLYQLLSEAKNKGDLTLAENTETTNTWTEWENKAKKNLGKASDQKITSEKISKLWGNYKSVDGGLKGYTLDLTKVFETHKALFEFATRIAKSYPDNLPTPKKRVPTGPNGVLGIDSGSNYLYTSSLSQVNGDWNKFIIRKSNDSKYYDFPGLINNDDNRQRELEESYNNVKPLIDSNGLYLNKGGQYSSNWEKFHQLVFFLGSTSGYWQSFAPAKENSSYRLVFKTSGDINANNNTYQFPNYTSDLYAPTKDEHDAGALAAFKWSSKRYVIYEKEKLTEELKKIETNISFVDSEPATGNVSKSEAALKTALTNVKFKTDVNEKDKLIGWIGTNFVLSSFDKKVQEKIYSGGKFYDPKREAAFVLANDADKVAVSSEETLQEDEADIRLAPTKFDESNTKHIITTQGANLIGIHANENEDRETKKFVNWLINEGNVKIDFEENKKIVKFDGIPLDYIIRRASYLLPSKDYLNNVDQTQKTSYEKVAIKAIKSIIDDPENYVAYSDPAEYRSATFRGNLDTYFVAANEEAYNFEKFIKELIKNIDPILKE